MNTNQEVKNDNNYKEYKEKNKNLQIYSRRQIQGLTEELIRKTIDFKEEYGIAPKERASTEELTSLFRIILDTDLNGTKAIRSYAKEEDKTEQWVKEIAKPKPKKALKIVLDSLQEHEVIKAMKKNKVYCEGDILNNTVTGALTKLSKQRDISNIIDNLKSEVATLKKNLANKEEGNDWKAEAIRLSKEGVSGRQIAKQLGVGKSTMADFLKDN